MLSDGAALPTGFAWPGTSNSKIQVNSADGAIMNSYSNLYEIKVTWTPTAGAAPVTYSVLKFAFTCTVTSWTLGSLPTNAQAYDVFSPLKIISFDDITYTQSPACGYAFTEGQAWDIPAGVSSVVTTGSYVTPSVHVKTTDTTKASGSAYTIKY